MKLKLMNKTKSRAKNTMLFVCVENTRYNQTTEAFLKNASSDIMKR
jgi:hypothetical protein